MKQFKELSIDEQLDLIKHVLEGGDLKYNTPAHGEGVFNADCNKVFLDKSYYYSKLPTKLETLYKEQQSIQSKIDAELKRLGEPVTRDNTQAVQSPSEQDKSSESEPMERITLENWKSLGIEVGDKVKVVNAYDVRESGIYTISNIEDPFYDSEGFLELDDSWWWYEDSDEVYLIRTKEGSLG